MSNGRLSISVLCVRVCTCVYVGCVVCCVCERKRELFTCLSSFVYTCIQGSFAFIKSSKSDYNLCCRELPCVAVCCRVLQCYLVCCSMLQYIAACCSVLQRVAVCCSVLQRVRVPLRTSGSKPVAKVM